MTSISRFLSSDHAHCDDRFAESENAVAAKDWARAQSALQHFLDGMKHHFAMEEDVLFPAFEAHTGMSGGPTQVMRGEHRQMNEVFAALRDALARQDGNGYLGLSETLLMLMRQHNMKEENMLYPMADQALADERDALLARMDATAP